MEYESRGFKDTNLLSEEYFDMIRPYLRNMINEHKNDVVEVMMGSETWCYQRTSRISSAKISRKIRGINERKRLCSK